MKESSLSSCHKNTNYHSLCECSAVETKSQCFPPNNPMKSALLSSFYQWRNRLKEVHLFKVIQPINRGEPRSELRSVLLQIHPLNHFLLPPVPMVSPGVWGGSDILNTRKVVILISDRIQLRDDITCPNVRWYSCLENKRVLLKQVIFYNQDTV